MSPVIFQYCVNQDASPFRQPTLMRIFGIKPLLRPRKAGEGDQAQPGGGGAPRQPSRRAPSVASRQLPRKQGSRG